MTATRYDAVIVGTGYAGAVTGARLAQGGMRVLLLERGPWWDSASADRAPSVGRDLPRGIGGSRNMIRNIRRANARRSREWRINTYGLYEIHRFQRLTVLGASGVGGGSHTDAGIQDEPSSQYWADFPAEITPSVMAPYIARVRTMSQLTQTPTHSQQPSPGVAGDAASPGLDLTYLPAALTAGAELWPLCEATRISTHLNGYAIEALDLRTGTSVTVHADRLVLAAGTMNTLRLLFAARDRDHSLPHVSRTLGQRFYPAATQPQVLGPIPSEESTHVASTMRPTGAGIAMLAKIYRPMTVVPADRLSATVRAVPGGVTADVTRQRSPETSEQKAADAKSVGPSVDISHTWLPQRLGLSAHPVGGAALASTRFQGVASHTGEVFGQPRLYVVDGSTLPTAPEVAPSLPIAALAERYAELMLQEA